jgi:hypothetical protein
MCRASKDAMAHNPANRAYVRCTLGCAGTGPSTGSVRGLQRLWVCLGLILCFILVEQDLLCNLAGGHGQQQATVEKSVEA